MKFRETPIFHIEWNRFYHVVGRQQIVNKIEIINKIEIFYLLLVNQDTQ